MKEIGKVVSVNDKKGQITVQFDRKSQCEKCGMCMMSKDSKNVELNLENKVNAEIDDCVEVSMGDSFVLASAIIVYLIPVILVAISFIFTRQHSESIQIIGLIISLVLGVIIAYIIDKIIKNHKGYKPEIINIVEKSKEEKKNGR